MPSESDTSALRDLLHNITLAQHFASGEDFISFRDDVMRVYATTRCLEIISEASPIIRRTEGSPFGYPMASDGGRRQHLSA